MTDSSRDIIFSFKAHVTFECYLAAVKYFNRIKTLKNRDPTLTDTRLDYLIAQCEAAAIGRASK